MKTDHTSEFIVEDITVGPFAHGFGATGDGRSFAFRTVRSMLTLEIYRADIDATGTAVPGPEDVVAVAEARVTDIDLDDERSVTATVRDLIAAATPADGPAADAGRETTIVRALLGRISSVIEGR
ncbi:hypothetical protein [Nocardia mexicana]|uniref:Uncharacterized protein n=1 Tax=Nocardia mexicana TaxID=279262 RepID=A0A370HDU5_9NOCA|nr:hypothetical protein [Nocardia mexicana]RDI55407.1 hypothetical protein DFR68_101240 [Nocardia mexicana]